MKLNFGPLFSAISKNFLFLDFFQKFQKFSLPIDWKLSKNIKTSVFQAILMVKSTKEWKKLKTKIQGVGGSNCSKFDFDHPFSPKQKFLQFSRFFKNSKASIWSEIRIPKVFNGSPFEKKLQLWSRFPIEAKSTGHPVYIYKNRRLAFSYIVLINHERNK